MVSDNPSSDVDKDDAPSDMDRLRAYNAEHEHKYHGDPDREAEEDRRDPADWWKSG